MYTFITKIDKLTEIFRQCCTTNAILYRDPYTCHGQKVMLPDRNLWGDVNNLSTYITYGQYDSMAG